MTKQIIEFKIELEESEPLIWRTFQVEANITFTQLHKIIQKIMGWEDYHLYEFFAGGRQIGKARKLFDIVERKGQKFSYNYDMGDFWEHKLTVKKIFETDDNDNKYPILLDGKMACPPEDCGGIGGYFNLLEIRENPNHPDYEDMIIDWLGEDFDPEYFNIDEVNKQFRKKTKAKK